MSLARESAIGVQNMMVRALNTGSFQIDAFRPAGIIGQVFDGSAQPASDRYNNIILTVINPGEDDTTDYSVRFGIAAEPIRPKQVGNLWVSGIVPAYTISESADDLYAMLEKGGANLTGGASGSTSLIWREDADPIDSEQIAVVRLGLAAPSSVTIPVHNKSGETAPLGAFIEVYDHDGTNYWFRKPTGANLPNVYILTAELADDAVGTAWERGITAPAYMGVTPGAGDIVGSVNGQWYGAISEDGSFVAVADEYITA